MLRLTIGKCRPAKGRSRVIPRGGAVVAMLLLTCAASAQVHEGVPPKPLRGGTKGAFVETGAGVTGRLYFLTEAKKVCVAWKMTDGPAELQRFSVSYYPTCVVALDETRWCVAGKRERGATVIEIWTIQAPVGTYPVPGQPGQPELQPASITDIETVYDEAVVDRDMVALMCAKREEPQSLLVQFWDSRDVYELDLETEVYELVASPKPATGILHAPPLEAEVYEQFWSREHTDKGFVYFLSAAGTGIPTLVLRDGDKNGTFDSWEVVGAVAWAADYTNDKFVK